METLATFTQASSKSPSGANNINVDEVIVALVPKVNAAFDLATRLYATLGEISEALPHLDDDELDEWLDRLRGLIGFIKFD
jgi:hypothetical protein